MPVECVIRRWGSKMMMVKMPGEPKGVVVECELELAVVGVECFGFLGDVFVVCVFDDSDGVGLSSDLEGEVELAC